MKPATSVPRNRQATKRESKILRLLEKTPEGLHIAEITRRIGKTTCPTVKATLDKLMGKEKVKIVRRIGKEKDLVILYGLCKRRRCYL